MNASAYMSDLIPLEIASGKPSTWSAEEREDFALMEKVAQGDERAFKIIVDKYKHMVVATATRMLGDPHEAEDVSQQVFVRLWQAASRWKPEAKFTTYLFTITKNLVYNASQKKSRRREDSLQEKSEHAGYDVVDERISPAELLEKKAFHKNIESAIASLPEQQRMAVILRTYENLDYEEIATALDTTVSSVKSLLFRARAVLRDKLKPLL